jgi:hypothetical protein
MKLPLQEGQRQMNDGVTLVDSFVVVQRTGSLGQQSIHKVRCWRHLLRTCPNSFGDCYIRSRIANFDKPCCISSLDQGLARKKLDTALTSGVSTHCRYSPARVLRSSLTIRASTVLNTWACWGLDSVRHSSQQEVEQHRWWVDKAFEHGVTFWARVGIPAQTLIRSGSFFCDRPKFASIQLWHELRQVQKKCIKQYS